MTTTLIWSLGPELERQYGQLAYDPSTGTLSPGDLAIQVPCAVMREAGKGE